MARTPRGDTWRWGAEFVERLHASDDMAALAFEPLVLTATSSARRLAATSREIDLDTTTSTIPLTV